MDGDGNYWDDEYQLNTPVLEQSISPNQNDTDFLPMDIDQTLTPTQIPGSTFYSAQNILTQIQASNEANNIFCQFSKLYAICLHSNPFIQKDVILDKLSEALVKKLAQLIIVKNETAKFLLENHCPSKEIIGLEIDQLVSLRKDPNLSYQSIANTLRGVYDQIDINIIAKVVELAERLPELSFNGNVEQSVYNLGFTKKQLELSKKFNNRDVYLLEWAFVLSNIGGHYEFKKILGETNDQLNSFLDWNVIDAFCCRYNSRENGIFVGSTQNIDCIETDTLENAVNHKGIYLQPFHHASHFFLVCVNFNKSPIEICLYDSLETRHISFNEFGFENAKSAAQKSLDKFVDEFGVLLNGQELNPKIAQDGFVQTDGHNCGVITIANVVKIAAGECMDVENPEIVRCKIAIQLLDNVAKDSSHFIPTKQPANFSVPTKRPANPSDLQNDMPQNKRQQTASTIVPPSTTEPPDEDDSTPPSLYFCTFSTESDFEKWRTNETKGWTRNGIPKVKNNLAKKRMHYRCTKKGGKCKNKIYAVVENGQVFVETTFHNQYIDPLLNSALEYNAFVEPSKNQTLDTKNALSDLKQDHLKHHHEMTSQNIAQNSTTIQQNYPIQHQICDASQMDYVDQAPDINQQDVSTQSQHHDTTQISDVARQNYGTIHMDYPIQQQNHNTTQIFAPSQMDYVDQALVINQQQLQLVPQTFDENQMDYANQDPTTTQQNYLIQHQIFDENQMDYVEQFPITSQQQNISTQNQTFDENQMNFAGQIPNATQQNIQNSYTNQMDYANQNPITSQQQLQLVPQTNNTTQMDFVDQIPNANQISHQYYNTDQMNYASQALTTTQQNYNTVSQNLQEVPTIFIEPNGGFNYSDYNFCSQNYTTTQQTFAPNDQYPTASQNDYWMQRHNTNFNKFAIYLLDNSIKNLQQDSSKKEEFIKHLKRLVFKQLLVLMPNNNKIKSFLLRIEKEQNSIMMIESFIMQQQVQSLKLKGFTDNDINRLRNEFTFVDRLLNKSDFMRTIAKNDYMNYVNQKSVEPADENQWFLVESDFCSFNGLIYTTKRLRRIQNESKLLTINAFCVNKYKFYFLVAGAATKNSIFAYTHVAIIFPGSNVYEAIVKFLQSISQSGTYVPNDIFANESLIIQKAVEYVFPDAFCLFHSDDYFKKFRFGFGRTGCLDRLTGEIKTHHLKIFLSQLEHIKRARDSLRAKYPQAIELNTRQERWPLDYNYYSHLLKNAKSVLINLENNKHCDAFKMFCFLSGILFFNITTMQMFRKCILNIQASGLTGLVTLQNIEVWREKNPRFGRTTGFDIAIFND